MGIKTSLASALLAALCTACAIYDPPSAAEGHALSQADIRPGVGRIESVGVIPHERSASAAAGASAPDTNGYRLYLQMQNGGSQTVDQDNPTFMPGELVEISPDGRVLRPAERL